MASSSVSLVRRIPIGAEVQDGGVHFRVWAPKPRSVEVIFPSGKDRVPLQPEGNGYFSALLESVEPGTRYKYRLDGGGAFPDPVSRFQPDGPHGFSQIVSSKFAWSDEDWPGCLLPGQVIYEMHIGTFTHEGTWLAAAQKLGYLRETGITLVEIMPVADFTGHFGWGYDGVLPYAPYAIYGEPGDFKTFVNEAHGLGIGVILDVVYNHMGPDGNYLREFSDSYFSQKHKTDWGPGINYDGPDCQPVREYVRENAAYWIREYHLDGLRLDATQDVHDDSTPHILAELSEAARAAAAKRSILLVGENEPQDTCLLRSCADGGHGLDALWNDDFHHAATVALTARADAYYTDYRGEAQEFVSAIKYGYLYQGQWYRWQKKRRGTPNWDSGRACMVTFIQNHDQVANSGRGLRLTQLTSPGRLKAMTALMCLGPGTPMLFQGQEFGATTPFQYFADHNPELAKMVRDGRAEFLAQWRCLRTPEMASVFANPADPETFVRSKLDFSEVDRRRHWYDLHRDLLALRRNDPVIARQGADGLDGAVLSTAAFVIRYFTTDHDEDRLLVVNLSTELERNPAPEPLLAPPAGKEWAVLWSSDDPKYMGDGTPPLDSDENWRIPGEAAVLLYPVVKSESKEKEEAQ